MSNFYRHNSYDVYYNTWYIDRTGDTNIYNNTMTNDILYNLINTNISQNIIDNNDNINNNIDNILYMFQDCSIREIERYCPICMEIKEPTDISRLNCTHTFCYDCITQHIDRNDRNQTNSYCPLCRNVITNVSIHL